MPEPGGNGAEDEIMMVGDDPDNELEDLSVTSSMKLMSVRFALPRILDGRPRHNLAWLYSHSDQQEELIADEGYVMTTQGFLLKPHEFDVNGWSLWGYRCPPKSDSKIRSSS